MSFKKSRDESMQMELISGIFIEECKSRFLCKVDINGQCELCYVSSSSKLAPFIELKGKEVVLIKNISTTSKTKYTLQAVKNETGYILLNLSFINRLLGEEFKRPESLYSVADRILSEKTISEGLKVDFFIEGKQDVVIEAKGIISNAGGACLPAMRVDRAVNQLKCFQKLLKKGISVHYYFVLMNPLINNLKLDKTKMEFYKLFRSCLKNGMQVFIYKVVWNEDNIYLARDKSIETLFLEI
jgi:DNA-binding sugar fermentation-stimulating protein